MGNTRWKGAFTGGFEAGYKNTCGTKEGWMPSQFISSVAKRHEKIEQNVMDYMDKEDFVHFFCNLGQRKHYKQYRISE